MKLVTRDVMSQYGFSSKTKLLSDVQDFRALLEAHKFTVDEAAPTGNPLVETLAGMDDGEFQIEDDLVVTPPSPPVSPEVDLATAKTIAETQVDFVAEQERLKYLTQGSGQALEYQATEDEAKAYLDDMNPIADSYPMLLAEQQAYAAVGQTVPLNDIASNVMDQAASWTTIGSAIKRIRLTAKMKIRNAGSKSEVADVLANTSFAELD